MKINVTISDGQLYTILENLWDDQKEKMIKALSYELIIEVWKMLRETDYDWYMFDTGWWRSWSEIREAIVKIQWIEKEYRKDKENVINAITRDRDEYRRYYNKMFELYHWGLIPYDYLPTSLNIALWKSNN